MFGYVRPLLNQLSEGDRSLYKHAYCGLCHVMGKRYGWLSRFSLNYDLAFLAVLLYGEAGDTTTCLARCPVHPFRKPMCCLCGDSLELAADESLILTWHKLSDDVADKGFIAGLPARFLRFLFGGAYRRACNIRPEFDHKVGEQLDKLRQLEASRSPNLDRAADTFAVLLAAAAGACAEESHRRAVEQLLYHLGRWIYLVDAWDDLAEDVKKGRYNPLDTRFEGRAAENREYIETTMTHSVRLCAAAANLVDFGAWTEIVNNVLRLGLPAVQKAVLDGKWKELRTVREKRK